MSFTSHVDSLRRSILYHIKNIWRIRKFVDTETCHHAVRAMVLSRLDYCNAIFTHLSSKDMIRLQRLQNNAARVIFAADRRTDAEPLLTKLHWLPVAQRVTFKILLFVYKALHDQAPPYITELFSYYVPGRPLRSSNDPSRLTIKRVKTTAGENRFPITAAKHWNSLPQHIRGASSTNSFKKMLKTHLF